MAIVDDMERVKRIIADVDDMLINRTIFNSSSWHSPEEKAATIEARGRIIAATIHKIL